MADIYDRISTGARAASAGISGLFTVLAGAGAAGATMLATMLPGQDPATAVLGGAMAAVGLAASGLSAYTAFKTGAEAVTGISSVPRGADKFGTRAATGPGPSVLDF
jgi:hypothetical protein